MDDQNGSRAAVSTPAEGAQEQRSAPVHRLVLNFGGSERGSPVAPR